jgi:hypothetical protein
MVVKKHLLFVNIHKNKVISNKIVKAHKIEIGARNP